MVSKSINDLGVIYLKTLRCKHYPILQRIQRFSCEFSLWAKNYLLQKCNNVKSSELGYKFVPQVENFQRGKSNFAI